ncbi:LPD7 domain-containing protein [Massilia sp. CCM 9210]|uniref:LPD7 domain-containing protein n=1 Tax=Massilia scottii TaxID=3057166 RepID=UPI002796AB55|nr:LPD7 domain-containing protein [Massilia sp. CCM 9210]MDQ1817755.1 LPD7 domain-containing protein [Massilia sp. CCM 9210]
MARFNIYTTGLKGGIQEFDDPREAGEAYAKIDGRSRPQVIENLPNNSAVTWGATSKIGMGDEATFGKGLPPDSREGSKEFIDGFYGEIEKSLAVRLKEMDTVEVDSSVESDLARLNRFSPERAVDVWQKNTYAGRPMPESLQPRSAEPVVSQEANDKARMLAIVSRTGAGKDYDETSIVDWARKDIEDLKEIVDPARKEFAALAMVENHKYERHLDSDMHHYTRTLDTDPQVRDYVFKLRDEGLDAELNREAGRDEALTSTTMNTGDYQKFMAEASIQSAAPNVMRVDLAKTWTTDQAFSQAQIDTDVHAAISKMGDKGGAEKFREEIAVSANVSPAYSQAMENHSPVLLQQAVKEAADALEEQKRREAALSAVPLPGGASVGPQGRESEVQLTPVVERVVSAEAQVVADFIAKNINRTPEKITENVRNSPPELQSLLADKDRMKAIEKDVNQKLSGINSAYIAETKAVMAVAAGRSDAQGVVKEAEALVAEQSELHRIRPATQDREDARKVAEFIGSNVNLTPEKITKNTENAPADLKAILADGEIMQRIEPLVDKQLVGISEKYIEETRSVISATLTRPAQVQESATRSAPVAERVVPAAEVPPGRNSSEQEEAAVLAESKRREALAAATGLSQEAGEKPSSISEDDKPAPAIDREPTSVARTVAANKMVDREDTADNSVDVRRKGGELERGEFIIPRRITQNYTEQDGKFYAKETSRMMFHDQGEKLATSTTDKAAIADMVAYAKAKQWDSLKLTGSQEFRREAWLQAESQGIKTQGFTPREKDLIELKTLTMERATNSITPMQDRAKDRKTLEQPVAAPRHDLNKNQAATASTAAQNTTVNMRELQEKPGMDRYSMEELSKIAFYRALVIERDKDAPQAVKDESLTKFDVSMRDPAMVKALPDPQIKSEQQTASKEATQKRDTSELSL